MKCAELLNALAKNPDHEITIWMTNESKQTNYQPRQESYLYGDVDLVVSHEYEDRDYVHLMFYK